MIVKLVEATKSSYGGDIVSLQEVYISTDQIACVRPVTFPFPTLAMPEGLEQDSEFSKVFLNHGQNGIAIIVVGPPALVESKINTAKRQLLKG